MKCRFFSNAAKPERERWIVKEFLQSLDISIAEADLQSLSEDAGCRARGRPAEAKTSSCAEVAPLEAIRLYRKLHASPRAPW